MLEHAIGLSQRAAGGHDVVENEAAFVHLRQQVGAEQPGSRPRCRRRAAGRCRRPTAAWRAPSREPGDGRSSTRVSMRPARRDRRLARFASVAQQHVAQARRPGERQRQRGKQRRGHGDGQRAEEDAGDAAHRNQRQKDDDRRDASSRCSGTVISLSALRTASARCSPVSRCITMFSTTTMASSITRPMAAARPPSVIRLKLSPITQSTHDRDGDGDRNHQAGNERRGPVAQEKKQDHAGQHQADEDGVAHAGDGVAHQLRLIVEELELHARRQLLAAVRQSRAATASATATVFAEGWRAMLSSTAFLPLAVTVV